jgi:hypothetical protein
MIEPTMLLTVLYDPSTRKFLGKHAEWVTTAEFAANPPSDEEDLMPLGQRQEFPPNVAGLIIGCTYKCVNHVLCCCTATRCTSLATPC